jgi:thioredoxin 1
MVKDITDCTFEHEVLEHHLPVLVDFWAPWCGPCRALAPVLEKIAAEREGTLIVVKLNVDENPVMTQKYEIVSVPSMFVFHGGQVVKQLVGPKPKPILEAELAEVLPASGEPNIRPPQT